MKKNLRHILSYLVLLILLIYNINFVSAETLWECKVESTPEYISEYIKNVRKVISNVNNNVKKQAPKHKWWVEKNKYVGKIYWGLNSLFSWNSNELNFEYSIQENTWEIPYQVKRDIKILKRESENLRLADVKATDVYIKYEDICKGIDEKICNFDKLNNISDSERKNDLTALQVLTILKNSTNKIKDFITNQATDINLEPENILVLFPPEDLESLKNDYSKINIQTCNKAESPSWKNWFFWEIIQSFNRISLLSNKSKNSRNEWKEAVDLLWWSASDLKYRQKEREVLAKELNKQWIWWDWASAIMWNLEAYNNSWTLLGWKYWFLNSIKEQINEFNETIKLDFLTSNSDWWTKWYKSTKDILDKIWKINEEEDVLISINSEYQKLKEISLNDDNSDDTLINRMINIHLRLTEWINIMNKSCEVSVKVCNSQKRWEWDCGQCY